MNRFFAALPLALLALPFACDGDETTTPAATASTSSSGGGGASASSSSQGGATASSSSSGGTGGVGGGGGAGGASCQNVLPTDATIPAKLSETGLYSDIVNKTLASYIGTFEPKYTLWSDGSDKTRYVYLPECGPIDTSNMDVWDFPVGTRMWKQFVVGGTLVETRLIERVAAAGNADDFIFAAYQWNGDDADHVPNGVVDASSTTHDIPSEADCKRCHGGSFAKGGIPSRFLGFSAMQLSNASSPVNITTLSNDGKLTVPAAAGFEFPGAGTSAQDALGVLHANCGNCHNDTADALIQTQLRLWVKTGDATVEATQTYMSAVDVDASTFGDGCDKIIAPGAPGNSCVSNRMGRRDAIDGTINKQMPPLGSDVVDTAGLASVDAWICELGAGGGGGNGCDGAGGAGGGGGAGGAGGN